MNNVKIAFLALGLDKHVDFPEEGGSALVAFYRSQGSEYHLVDFIVLNEYLFGTMEGRIDL